MLSFFNEISILYEKRMIEEFLKQANNNQSEAARNLGMTRKTLAKKIQKYHIIINLKKENEPTIFYQ